MPSLYSENIIRGKEIGEKKLISPPIFEKIYKGIEEEYVPKNEIDVDAIYNSIEEDAINKGKKIVEEYTIKAKELLEKANQDANEIKETAKENGYQEGYKAGYKEGYEFGSSEAKEENKSILDESKSIREEAKKYLETCHRESREYVQTVEGEIVHMSIEIARKILNKEILESEEAVLSLVEKAILKCANKKQIIINVNLKNASILKANKERLSEFLDDECNLLIIPDGEIEVNEFKIETSSGFIDASIEVQLEKMLQNLLGEK